MILDNFCICDKLDNMEVIDINLIHKKHLNELNIYFPNINNISEIPKIIKMNPNLWTLKTRGFLYNKIIEYYNKIEFYINYSLIFNKNCIWTWDKILEYLFPFLYNMNTFYTDINLINCGYNYFINTIIEKKYFPNINIKKLYTDKFYYTDDYLGGLNEKDIINIILLYEKLILPNWEFYSFDNKNELMYNIVKILYYDIDMLPGFFTNIDSKYNKLKIFRIKLFNKLYNFDKKNFIFQLKYIVNEESDGPEDYIYAYNFWLENGFLYKDMPIEWIIYKYEYDIFYKEINLYEELDIEIDKELDIMQPIELNNESDSNTDEELDIIRPVPAPVELNNESDSNSYSNSDNDSDSNSVNELILVKKLIINI